MIQTVVSLTLISLIALLVIGIFVVSIVAAVGAVYDRGLHVGRRLGVAMERARCWENIARAQANVAELEEGIEKPTREAWELPE
jgi:hypothetical protein